MLGRGQWNARAVLRGFARALLRKLGPSLALSFVWLGLWLAALGDRGWACRGGRGVQPSAAGYQQGTVDLAAFVHPDVKKAPPPQMGAALPPGGEAIFSDSRGTIRRVHLGGGLHVNIMRTRAGARRSGDLHNCTQYDLVLSGSTELLTKGVKGGGEERRVYGPAELLRIPPGAAHMFSFPKESWMVEWWDCPFEAWHYRPLRQVVDGNVRGVRAGRGKRGSIV